MAVVPGLAVVVALAAVAFGVGLAAPVLGAPVVAIVLGLAAHQIWGDRPGWRPGVRFASKKVLQAAIVVLGLTMSLGDVVRIGGQGLPVLLGTLALALTAGWVLRRLLKVEAGVGKLVTYGTTICGASAIATMSVVLGSSATEVALSIAVIVVFNVAGAIVFPLVGHALGLSQEAFGLWAGTAINDTSSVVAAATVYGAAAASYAVVVKLTRTLAIIPLAIAEGARQASGERRPWTSYVPPFLLLFVLAAGVRSTGIVPDAWVGPIKQVALVGTTIAMAGVGLSSSFSKVREAGWRPIALGGSLWLVLALASLGLQALTGQL